MKLQLSIRRRLSFVRLDLVAAAGRRRLLALLVPALGATLQVGCAPHPGSPADHLFRDGVYGAAVAAYEYEEQQSPEDARVKRNLGAALFHDGQLPSARTKLMEAMDLDPEDLQIVFLLARVEDELGATSDALLHYTDFVRRGGHRSGRVRSRMEELGRQVALERLSQAVAFEADLRADPPPDRTVAVTAFINLLDDPELAPLSRGLAAVLISDLRKARALRLVERTQIQTLFDEITLSSPTGSAPDSTNPQHANPISSRPVEFVNETAPKLGQILAARHIIQGSVLSLKSGRIQLAMEIHNVVDGTTVSAGEPVEGELRHVLRVEKQLVYQIFDAFEIEPTPEERRRIDEISTSNFAAFLDFSLGLYLEDQGDIEGARAAYAKAREKDPQFGDPGDRLEVLDSGPEDLNEVDQTTVDYITDDGSGDSDDSDDSRDSDYPGDSDDSGGLVSEVAGSVVGMLPPDSGGSDGDDAVENPAPNDAVKVGGVNAPLPDFPTTPWENGK